MWLPPLFDTYCPECGEGWWWVKFQDHSYFYAEKQLLVIEEV